MDLRQLEDYVALEQVRFGDKIEFYTDIEMMNFMIPPLILQPVVENAIKHGISKKAREWYDYPTYPYAGRNYFYYGRR